MDLILYSYCPIGILNQLRHLKNKVKTLLLQSVFFCDLHIFINFSVYISQGHVPTELYWYAGLLHYLVTNEVQSNPDITTAV
jgi:hypothetical protein